MYQTFRNILFKLPPESAHELTMEAIAAGERLGINQQLGKKISPCPVNIMGLQFPNPVGLAAGLDKNGDYFNGLGALGFGFVEIGTITPRPQPGNPKPRMFRLPEQQGIINRLGFNNLGVNHLVQQVKKRRYKGILGINIGKNFDTPLEQAAIDYLAGLNAVYDYADYITVNISSPNTPGLRELQSHSQLGQLLQSLRQQRDRLAETKGRKVPLVVKIAPDMDSDQIKQISETLLEQQLDGVIATNTTISRDAVQGAEFANEQGGLSGAPLFSRSTEIIGCLAEALAGQIPIIGVGGICSGDNAKEKIRSGASLVQLYTGFIYRGPALIKEAVDAIASFNRF